GVLFAGVGLEQLDEGGADERPFLHSDLPWLVWRVSSTPGAGGAYSERPGAGKSASTRAGGLGGFLHRPLTCGLCEEQVLNHATPPTSAAPIAARRPAPAPSGAPARPTPGAPAGRSRRTTGRSSSCPSAGSG